MIHAINSIIEKTKGINPTILFNEGWMIRLLIYYSVQENLKIGNIDFSENPNWTSEALIDSPFVRTQSLRENHTHTDIILGDFSVEFKNRGAITVNPGAQRLGIIEAKMNSNLSQSVANAKDYNQASRSIACLAYNTWATDCDIFFTLAVPEATIKKKKFEDQLNKELIASQIEQRFNQFEESNQVGQHKKQIMAKVKKCVIDILPYEDWMNAICDVKIKTELTAFYTRAIEYNRVK